MQRLTILLLAALALGGCVERRMYITSRPAGADVYVDGQYAGKTPLRIPFAHYGTRTITLRDPNHVSVLKDWEIDTPWFEYFPIDFFTEWLWPGTLVDEHRLDIEMEPTPPVTADKLAGLRERAEALRVDGRKQEEVDQ